ncbi:MAG TPA: N-acetylmuramoyl-L-alanine amidase, partial [Phycicoccus sp.]|nr:N-acetylmuramoyl-L-alanine amidase [Phycicoccus sp.]
MPFRFRTLVRPLSLLTAAALALVTPVALTGPTSAAPRPHPVASGRHVVGLSPMTSSAARSTGAGGGAESQVVETPGGLRVIGLSWPRGSIAATDRIEVRERTGAHWGPWEEMHADDADGPDPGTRPAGTTREGTEPWITTADAVQVRVLGPASAAAARASLDVIDPRHSVADVAPDSGAGAAVAAGVRPTIYSRAQWGADESIRTWAPSYGTIRAAVVHHTAGSNTYTAADVPAIIRGIYVFHTLGRDWGDIGYNFLIDKFGRIWEGRYGGVDKPTIGGHAAPFNSQTYGASVLGDFTSVTPPAAVVTAQARLAAWKLGLTHINPTGTTVLDGKGTTPTIVGHRDLNQTSCPGTYLYGRLGAIRSQARSYQGTMVYYPAISAGSVAYGGGGVTVTGRPTTGVTWRLTVSSVCRPDVTWSTSGTASSSAPIAATWPGTLPGGSPARPGDYRVVLTATSGSSTAATDSVEYTVTVRSAAGAPASFCPPRLEGGNRYETAVAVSRAQDPNARTVVLASGEQRAMADALVAAPLARARQGVLLLT